MSDGAHFNSGRQIDLEEERQPCLVECPNRCAGSLRVTLVSVSHFPLMLQFTQAGSRFVGCTSRRTHSLGLSSGVGAPLIQTPFSASHCLRFPSLAEAVRLQAAPLPSSLPAGSSHQLCLPRRTPQDDLAATQQTIARGVPNSLAKSHDSNLESFLTQSLTSAV